MESLRVGQVFKQQPIGIQHLLFASGDNGLAVNLLVRQGGAMMRSHLYVVLPTNLLLSVSSRRAKRISLDDSMLLRM